jgi:hypothetical protein
MVDARHLSNGKQKAENNQKCGANSGLERSENDGLKISGQIWIYLLGAACQGPLARLRMGKGISVALLNEESQRLRSEIAGCVWTEGPGRR